MAEGTSLATEEPGTGRGGDARNGGIDLIRVIAMLLIAISHVVHTLSSPNPYIAYGDYLIELKRASGEAGHFALTLFAYFGALGNTLFFVCSAWLLLRSRGFNKRKWFFMLCEVWAVSAAVLIICFLLRGGKIAPALILKSLLPTTFANNWYVTCYLLFYPIHPLLNRLIRSMSRRALLRGSLALAALYLGFNFLDGELFFPSPLVLWVALYWIMAYMQLYMPRFAGSRKANVLLLFAGIGGYVAVAAAAYFLGLRYAYFADKVLRWNTNSNPFLFAASVAALNLLRTARVRSRAVSGASKLSLLVYIIHQNLLLRTYYRPAVLQHIYRRFGYRHIALWTLALGAGLFLFALGCAFVYDRTLRAWVKAGSERLYLGLRRLYLKWEDRRLGKGP